MDQNTALGAHVAKALDWQEAHVGFDKAVAGLPAELRGWHLRPQRVRLYLSPGLWILRQRRL